MSLYIGIDLGGTKSRAALYDAKGGRVLHHHIVATSHDGADRVIAQMCDQVRALATKANVALEEIAGVGVGLPATIDHATGSTLLLPNIPGEWHGKRVRALMEAQIAPPVHLINDARAFTLAEAALGAGRGYPVVACFTLGTGIGGGIAIDGRLFMGMDGSAGEFGHMSIDFNALPDGSGTPGGLERFGSGPAITAEGVRIVIQGADTEIGALVDYDLNRITPAVIARAADDGDEEAGLILQRAGRTIGVGIANVLTILNPHAVVIGGGLAALGERLMQPIRATLVEYNKTTNLDALHLVSAQLGDDAGAIGAALWAVQQNSA